MDLRDRALLVRHVFTVPKMSEVFKVLVILTFAYVVFFYAMR